MDKRELLGLLKAFPYSPDDYWIVAGGAMVMYGIRPQTHDIDLGCNEQMADSLEADGYLVRTNPDGRRYFRYSDDIEISEGWLNDTFGKVDGYNVISIKGLLEMKRELGREKDKRDIALIEEFLK